MKKLIFSIVMLFTLINVNAQNVQSVNLSIDCNDSSFTSTIQMDSAYENLVWLEFWNGSGWVQNFESLRHYSSPQDTFIYSYNSSTPILNGDYRLGFCTANGLILGPVTYIDSVTANCGNYVGIPDNEQAIGDPIKIEYYNLSGQSVEVTNSGMYVIIKTYSNGFQVRTKQFITR